MALTKAGELDAFEAEPSVWPPEDEYDLVLFDGWLPETWPEDMPAIVMRPPRSLGPVRAVQIENEDGLAVDQLRAINERHPVLYGVASERVALTQTAVLEAAGSLVPLWVGPVGPLMVAGEVRGQRLVVMAFAAERSERLPFMASYPLLLGNAILWLTETEEGERAGNNMRTGHVIDVGLRLETGASASFTPPSFARTSHRG